MKQARHGLGLRCSQLHVWRVVGKCGYAWDAWHNDGDDPTTLHVHTTTTLSITIHLSTGHQKEGRAEGGEKKDDEILWKDM